MVLADEGKDYQMFSRCHSMARARDYDDSRSIIRLKWDEGIFDFAAHDFFFLCFYFKERYYFLRMKKSCFTFLVRTVMVNNIFLIAFSKKDVIGCGHLNVSYHYNGFSSRLFASKIMDVLLNGLSISAKRELQSLCCMMGNMMSLRCHFLATNGWRLID